MAGGKKVVQLEYNSDIDSLIKDINKLMTDSNKPELVYIKTSLKMFPRMDLDLPEKLRTLLGKNPRVKVEWNKHDYIDMTMVSVFYDANINPLRKIATKKAISCWMKQSCLPKEMMFIELGFDDKFTFSEKDFPSCIHYIRI